MYIPLGVDLHDAPEALPPRPRTPLRFGFVAGFQLHKGIWHVLDACAALKRQGLSFELHVWGPDDERASKEIVSRGLQDRVFSHGLFRRDQMWQVYREIDVAVMATTVCEPLGRVPLEAAAAGAPTIAPAVGGIPESIRHEEDGLLYRFLDVEDLERQMRRVLEERELALRLIGNVRRPPNTADMAAILEAYYFDAAARTCRARDKMGVPFGARGE